MAKITFDSSYELETFINQLADKVKEKIQGKEKTQQDYISLKEAAALLGVTADYLRRPAVRARFNHFQLANHRISFQRQSILNYLAGKNVY